MHPKIPVDVAAAFQADVRYCPAQSGEALAPEIMRVRRSGYDNALAETIQWPVKGGVVPPPAVAEANHYPELTGQASVPA